ncbi:hypothetical protein AJ80_07976 [Polytolypa hystricis UAMH7299]|uniref:Extracellular protein n=1 Tax=Polytolypa hystricis (strain UAMH7299) TaxID=1447883 RepID=A0A2B7XFZ4_POLH7|nr:hypothetical protein AJ80_07976 [Polytolypa hystricis UAMH7299]
MKVPFLFFLLGIYASHVLGHMQMSNPLPVRSPLDPAASNKDTSYTNPLSSSGTDFPCKGYHNDPFRATAQYNAGGEYQVSIVGGASHTGGSCQFSLSYDNGKSFKVIKSIVGGCPLQPSYSFTVPSDAPSGNALFAWTWFNRIGNREMYMNCAHVTISGGSGGGGGDAADKGKRAVAFTSRPEIFKANIANGCTTQEQFNVIFPNPGDEVENGGGMANAKPGNGYTCAGENGGSAPGGPTGGNPPPQGQPQAPPQAPAPPVQQPPPNQSSPAPVPAPSPGNPPAQPSPPPSQPSPSTLLTMVSRSQLPPNPSATPEPNGGSNSSSPAPPAPGPKTPSGPPNGGEGSSGGCAPGTLRCDSEITFSLCAGNGYVFMGSVAKGTVCRNGAIGFP